MSSTNKTVTIELSQYVGTDKPTYLSDYNGDMLKIDNAIAADRDSIATAQNTADGADGKADANARAIATISDAINNTSNGLAKRVTDVEGDVNTIESLIGNGEPTTQDKTIIGAINELAANMPSPTTQLPATSVSYNNASSGLSATNAQAAIDELASAIPSAASVELQRGTLTAGQTSVVLTFAAQTIGASSLVDVYVEDGIDYDSIATTATTVTLTFAAQSANKAVAVRVTN